MFPKVQDPCSQRPKSLDPLAESSRYDHLSVFGLYSIPQYSTHSPPQISSNYVGNPSSLSRSPRVLGRTPSEHHVTIDPNPPLIISDNSSSDNMYLSVPPTNSSISSVYAVRTRAASVSSTTDSEVEFLPTSTSVALPSSRSSFFPISNPDIFFSYLFGSSSRRDAYSAFRELRDSIPPSPTNLYTPIQLACMWLTEQFTQDPFIDLAPTGEVNLPKTTYAYKKVANKTKPVATTLPEEFRIIRHEHPNPLKDLKPLPTNPPDFVPGKRFTQERRDRLGIGKGFLLPEETKLAEWIMLTHEAAFAWTDDERGTFSPEYFAPIEIPHISHVPWALKQGPIPRGIMDEVIKIIENKMKSGVYEPSSSSYNTRWFCVYKKDGKSLRLVHSLEPLNAVTIRNSAMPPYTDLVAEDFAGKAIYTTLDLYVSFDQRQLHEKSRDMTTFDTPLGALRLTVLPMGWTNSPAVLQGDVTHMLRPEIPHKTLPFIDDINIKGPNSRYELPDGTYETIPENPGIRRFVWEHFIDVHRIVHRVESYKATFSGPKTCLGIERPGVLGHVCAYEGRIVDPSRAKAIQNWPVPTNVSEVRSFLGTCGVLRIFIKNYTLVARPLIQLTRKDAPFEIGSAQLEAIAQLKSAVADSPALKPIVYESDRPVILAVDSCANGVGYILLQIGADKKRYPSCFGSITFNDRESRYSQAKLELYGLFRALKATQLYTIGAKKFVVEMDAKFIKGMINNPTLHPNDAINRWIAAILLFDFELVHIPADKHTGADGLSRRPHAPEDPEPDDPDELEDWIDTNAGFFISINSPPSRFDSVPPIPLFAESRISPIERKTPSAPDPVSLSPSSSRSSSPEPDDEVKIPRSSKAEIRDEKLSVIRKFLATLERPPDLSDDEYKQFIRQAMNYFLLDGRMFRKVHNNEHQLVPKPPDRLRLISYAHDELGHKGVFATSRNLLVRFWWPMLNDDVRWYIRTCHQCQVRQTTYFHIPPVVPDIPSIFLRAHIDTFLMPKVGSYRYCVHARCATISYPEGQALTKDSGQALANFIFNLMCRWGGLAELVTDNGTAYISAIDILGKQHKIFHIKISGYNSQANGIVESKHFDVREAIMKTCDGDESKWRQVLPTVLWAERVTIRKATGFSPYYMAHGVHPLLPFDIVEATYLSPTQNSGITTEELIALRAQQLSKRPQDIEHIQTMVSKFRKRSLEQFEKRHGSRIHDFDFKPGALVLVRNSRIEKTLNRKTKPRYYGPMVVVRKTIGTSYVIQELDGSESTLRVAGFRLIPYFPRTTTSIPVQSLTPENKDITTEDPEDTHYLDSLAHHNWLYTPLPVPRW